MTVDSAGAFFQTHRQDELRSNTAPVPTKKAIGRHNASGDFLSHPSQTSALSIAVYVKIDTATIMSTCIALGNTAHTAIHPSTLGQTEQIRALPSIPKVDGDQTIA